MNLLLSLTLITLPLPLLIFAVRSAHLRLCLPPFVAVLAIYVFMCLGSPRVIYNPTLYTDTYLYTLLLIIAGCYAMYGILLAVGRDMAVDFTGMKPEPSIGMAVVFLAPLWVVSFGILALYVSRHGLPPLFAISRGLEYVDLYAVRAEKTTSLAEGVHWYVVGLQTIPYCALIYTYILKRQHPTTATRLLFLTTAVVTLVLATAFANKDVLLHIAVFLLLARFFLGGPGLRLRHVLVYGTVGLASIFVFYRLYLLDRPAGAVLKLFGNYLIERLLVVYTEAHAYIVQIFPREHPFFDGHALANPGGLLPFTPVDLAQFLGYRTLGQLANYASPSFSQAYANFGVAGIALIVGLMTFQIILLQAVFRRLPKQPLFLALYVLLTERMIKYGSDSIQAVFAEELVVVFLAMVVWYVFVRQVWGALQQPLRPGPAEPAPGSL